MPPLEERLRYQPGSVFDGRYTIIECIGEGGMGVVYKAIDTALDQVVALKLIKPELARHRPYIERFRREVRVTQQITHTNVCRVHDLGEWNGILYFSMQWIDGETLRRLLNQAGCLRRDRALEIAEKIALGLAAAHSKGIVHRDLKPENVMIGARGEVFVMDFGVAAERVARPSDTDGLAQPGPVYGTLGYIAPEQERGERVDARADLYVLGLILREMLTGRSPLHDKGARSSGHAALPAKIQPVVDKLLAGDRDKRYASAEVVAGILHELQEKHGQGWRIVIAAVRIAAAAGLATILIVHLRRPPPYPPLVERGLFYVREGETVAQFDDAIGLLHRAIQEDSTQAVTWAFLGEAYWGRFERTKEPLARQDAQRAVARAIQLGADLAETRNANARGLIDQGRFQEAVEELQRAVEREPDFAAAWANFGRAYQGLGKYALGLRALEKACSLQPQNFRHWIVLGVFQQRFGMQDEAEKAYRHAIALKPDSPMAWHNLGAVLLQGGKPAVAESVLNRALLIEDRAPSRHNLGEAYYQMHEYQKAVDQYRRAAELESHAADHQGGCGDALTMLGRLAEAQEAYRRAVELARERVDAMPQDPNAHIALALWCARAGDSECATREADIALQMQPQSARVLFQYALVQCQCGRRDAALEWLEKAVRLGVKRAEIETDLCLARYRGDARYAKILDLAK